MPNIYEIPLSAQPQRFSIVLGGETFQLTLVWRDPAPGWVLDFADADGDYLIQGVPLVTGADLLAQYGYLGVPGRLHVQNDSVTDQVPSFADLGSNSRLYFVTG